MAPLSLIEGDNKGRHLLVEELRHLPDRFDGDKGFIPEMEEGRSFVCKPGQCRLYGGRHALAVALILHDLHGHTEKFFFYPAGLVSGNDEHLFHAGCKENPYGPPYHRFSINSQAQLVCSQPP